MRATIEKLRSRPKEDRQMIATVSSGAVVAVLLLGWGISTMGMFSNISESQTAAVASSDPNIVQQMQATTASYTAQLKGNQPQVVRSPAETGAVVTIPASE